MNRLAWEPSREPSSSLPSACRPWIWSPVVTLAAVKSATVFTERVAHRPAGKVPCLLLSWLQYKLHAIQCPLCVLMLRGRVADARIRGRGCRRDAGDSFDSAALRMYDFCAAGVMHPSVNQPPRSSETWRAKVISIIAGSMPTLIDSDAALNEAFKCFMPPPSLAILWPSSEHCCPSCDACTTTAPQPSPNKMQVPVRIH